MHCRFYSEHLIEAYDIINEGSAHIGRPLEMVKASIEFMNDPVLLLGDILPFATTKYSVKGMNTSRSLQLTLLVAYAT